jgi:hypothetical protein
VPVEVPVDACGLWEAGVLQPESAPQRPKTKIARFLINRLPLFFG